MSSTDESEEEQEAMAEKEARQQCRQECGSDTEFLAVLDSIGMDDDRVAVDEATARLVDQHV